MRNHLKEQAAVDALIKENTFRNGPWHISKYTDGSAALIYDADGFEVARVCYPNRNASARLIAAAPDLLDVAISVLDHATVEMPQALIAAAELAVSKATGCAA